MREILFNKEVIGEVGKNVGLGIFVSGIYGISDGSIEIFNVFDISIGFIVMLFGIIMERSWNEQLDTVCYRYNDACLYDICIL